MLFIISQSPYDNSISFETAWSPCSPVIAALAKQFPEAGFYYNYEESGMCFCGAEEYRNGKLVYSMEGDLKYYFFDDDAEPPYDDGLFPNTIEKPYGYRELFVPIEKKINGSGELLVGGRFYSRDYEDGRLFKSINGIAVYRDKEPECWY